MMYVLHVPTDDARTYVEEEKLPAAVSTYLLLYVRIYCTYLVLVYLLTYVRTLLVQPRRLTSTHSRMGWSTDTQSNTLNV